MEEGRNFFTINKTQKIVQIPIVLEESTTIKIAPPGEQFIFSKIDEKNYSIKTTSGLHGTVQPTKSIVTKTTSMYTTVRCSTSTNIDSTQQTLLQDRRPSYTPGRPPYQPGCKCNSCMMFRLQQQGPKPFVPFVPHLVSLASMNPMSKPVFVDSKGKTNVAKKPTKRHILPEEEGGRGGGGGGGGGAKEPRLRPDLTRVSNVGRGAKKVEIMRTPPAECLIKEECYTITAEDL